MPISHGFRDSLSCGEVSISNIFLPTGMDMKPKESCQNILRFLPHISFPTLAPFKPNSRTNTSIPQKHVEDTQKGYCFEWKILSDAPKGQLFLSPLGSVLIPLLWLE